jgi:hypothetical protein
MLQHIKSQCDEAIEADLAESYKTTSKSIRKSVWTYINERLV